ncbi:MAG: response regulator [Nitrospirota bacterium]
MNQKDIKVLVVDDEVAFADTLAQRLKIRDLNVMTAYNGEDALLKLKEDKSDVVILDLRMPGMHGLEVLQEIRKSYPDIQVIVLTGHGTERDEEEVKQLGGFDLIRKPADINHLEHKIRKAFREKCDRTMSVMTAITEEKNFDTAQKSINWKIIKTKAAFNSKEEVNMSEEIKADVLLVDDEEQFLKVLSQRLEGRGMKVDTSTSGEDALKMVKGKEFDAIILDLAMPGMNGIETLKRIKDENPDVQIIMLTGHGSVEKGVEAIKEGAVDFLEKPADLNKIMGKIAEAKRKRAVLVQKKHEGHVKKILQSKGW